MKITAHHILFFVVIVIMITATSCQSDTNSNETTTTESAENIQAAADAKQKADAEMLSHSYGARASYDFKLGLDTLISFYQNISAGLANNNLQGARNNILFFTEAMRSIPNTGVSAEGQSILDTQRTLLIKHINGIATATDMNVARVNFYDLSNAMVELVRTFGTNNENVYLMHSEKAFNGSGAYWLSLKNQIRNPYFGSENMSEGEMKEVFSAK